MDVRDSRVHNYPPRWNGALSQDLLVIRRNHHTGMVSLDPLRWGLIPYSCPEGRAQIAGKVCEMIAAHALLITSIAIKLETGGPAFVRESHLDAAIEQSRCLSFDWGGTVIPTTPCTSLGLAQS